MAAGRVHVRYPEGTMHGSGTTIPKYYFYQYNFSISIMRTTFNHMVYMQVFLSVCYSQDAYHIYVIIWIPSLRIVSWLYI